MMGLTIRKSYVAEQRDREDEQQRQWIADIQRTCLVLAEERDQLQRELDELRSKEH